MKVMVKPGTPRSGRKEVITSVELKGRWGGGGGCRLHNVATIPLVMADWENFVS